jgi:hypothetical protein
MNIIKSFPEELTKRDAYKLTESQTTHKLIELAGSIIEPEKWVLFEDEDKTVLTIEADGELYGTISGTFIDAFIKAMESRKKRIEGAYIYALKTLGTDAILTNKGEMKVRKNPPSVVIDDVAKIPTEFQKQKIDVTIDKVALKKAIQSGEKVDGAHIEQNEKLVY